MDQPWKCYGKCRKGELHEREQLRCQDQIAYGRRGTRQAIALVDGVGRTDYNPVAGERVAEMLAEFLMEHFEDIRTESPQLVGKALMRNVYDIIQGVMRESHLPAGEFGSTILGFCIDLEKHSYCAVHLGDGVIVSMGEENRILSYPFNGAHEGETCLSLSNHVLQKIKFFTGDTRTLKSVALCSDGVYGTKAGVQEVFQRLERFKKTFRLPKREDDQSVILLEFPQTEIPGYRLKKFESDIYRRVCI